MEASRASAMKNNNVNGFGMEGELIFHFKHNFGTYATGGEAVDFSNFIQTVDNVVIPPNGTYHFVYDRTNKKILAYTMAGVQVANATDLSAVTCYGTVFGH